MHVRVHVFVRAFALICWNVPLDIGGQVCHNQGMIGIENKIVNRSKRRSRWHS